MLKKYGLFYLLLLFFVIDLSFAQVQINEIMYSPYDGNEWVELYNPSNQTINLTSWVFSDESGVDEIVCCEDNCSLSIDAKEHLILLDQDSTLDTAGFNYVCVDDDSLGNHGLNDEGETITISNGNYSNSLMYQKENGAYKNNKTLERREDRTFGQSIEFFGTPGRENSIWQFSKDYSDLKITEFLPDPFDKDDLEKPLGEWVEIYNKGDFEIDISGLLLTRENFEDELHIADNKVFDGTVICGGCYKVIYRDGDSDFSLNNRGFGKVNLYTNEVLIDSVSYSGSTEGMSWSKVNKNWYQTETTQSEENYYESDCDWDLEISTGNSIFQKDDFEFNLKVNRNLGFTQNITVRGSIEDYYGQVIKKYSPWSNYKISTVGTKKYSPNLAEGIYQLKFQIENLSCSDLYQENNIVTKFIAINPEYKVFSNDLKIEKIYLGSDGKAEWADQFTAKLKIYKGNDTKTAIEIWVEKGDLVVSKRSKLNVYDKFQTYTLTLPIQLHPNCANEDGSDGNAKLILNGLGLRREKDFLIEGIDPEVCKDYSAYIKDKERKDIKEKKKNSYQILNLPNEVYSGDALRIKVQQWDNKEHDFKVWSYLYRGSKCYSCLDGEGERDNNLIRFNTRENELKIVDLLIKLDSNLEEGEYKLAVNFLKDNRKTPIKIREKIFVKKKEVSDKDDVFLNVLKEKVTIFSQNKKENLNEMNPKISRKHVLNNPGGVIIYESNSEKSKKLIPYLLITVFAMLSITLIWNKEF